VGIACELGLVPRPLRIIDFSIICKVLDDFLLSRHGQRGFVSLQQSSEPTTNTRQSVSVNTSMKIWHLDQSMKNGRPEGTSVLRPNKQFVTDVCISHPTGQVLLEGS